MKKTVTAWILALVLLCVGAFALAEEPVVQDRAGNPITLPETVERVVSLAPSITQVIADLGLGDTLVAVDQYSQGIEGVPEDVLTFDIMTPDAEQIIALDPDLVLLSGMTLSDGSDPLAQLTELGICVAYVPSSESIDAILEDNLFIGEILGNPEGAQALNDRLTEAIEALRVETETPRRVYFEISPAPYLYSFGTGTFLNEMIALLGGVNIFADQTGWLSVSEEAVIAADPEIIFTSAEWAEDPVGEILARDGWADVTAVREGAVYLIDEDAASQPNHRIVLALEEMAEAFADQ
ncbi:MAG: ABC transporter substrate-binding protein [Christensenellales bacterium]|jgi:iron complex transport system substrate-binding protein|uniref:ABC transporter substrate-binding protein n=1 Tax=Candidatus Avichristensenella intestinipullorum TaxID=2840693 RepID=A0A9D0YUJ5_9FIRM|nr:ABC transporter substrate-binding protein [Christensenellales bacterium]HIQ62125.1 ABC transporter substrate-binding protein [Candidatus Avichristensenella intestinipullorum]